MAGGMGKRMKSELPKVLHKLNGKPLIKYVIELAKSAESERILLVLSFKKELVIEAVRQDDVEWVEQQKPLGTADAVKSCMEALKDYRGNVLILSGDVPLLKIETVRAAYALHTKTGAVATVLTFKPVDPKGYGRVIRGSGGEMVKIVEEKDASDSEKLVDEVNSGIYFYKWAELSAVLGRITNDNKAGEYYLPDAIPLLVETGQRLSAYFVEDPVETAGVNTIEHLQVLDNQMRD